MSLSSFSNAAAFRILSLLSNPNHRPFCATSLKKVQDVVKRAFVVLHAAPRVNGQAHTQPAPYNALCADALAAIGGKAVCIAITREGMRPYGCMHRGLGLGQRPPRIEEPFFSRVKSKRSHNQRATNCLYN